MAHWSSTKSISHGDDGFKSSYNVIRREEADVPLTWLGIYYMLIQLGEI